MNTFEKFATQNKELLAQEELILDATELLSKIMKDDGITKAELANRLGKTKAFVTQCLSGQQNLTLRTLSDLFTALDQRAYLGSEPRSSQAEVAPRLYPVKNWAFEKVTYDASTVIDCAAGTGQSLEATLCDAA